MKFQNRVFPGQVKFNTDYSSEVDAEIRGISLEDYGFGDGSGMRWDTGSRKKNGRREEKEKSMP